MFLDRYFIINDFENADPEANIMPRIGIYDKWDPNNKIWRPTADNDSGSGNDDKSRDMPIDNPIDDETTSGGIGTFWTIFLILFFLGGAAALFKLFGK